MVMNAILLDAADNVVTCVKEIQAGEEVRYRHGEEIRTLAAEELIPYCHKIALETLEKGAQVIKYGETIGKTSEKIEKGHWVSHLNIYSVPRDYESEYVPEPQI
ncbi:hydrolase [Clostridium sp. MCC353]|uniref:UxaA family hydrolase n=1 Tax=Clostridium sp. MCC353 TaxID=2592646 RepID=UPI001C0386DE|nr:UxaA family hydrolase [Clostridium sp. MCC353]MBT9776084.1 hydrolase [Clostridium sp. MCC353]